MKTIILTHQPPVRIDEATWPVIAHAKYHRRARRAERDQTEHWSASVTVRRHADGRAIVDAHAEHWYMYAGHGEYDRRKAELLAPGDDLVTAIRRIVKSLDIEDERHLTDECIAGLPAADLD
jgi:hypothetical protein